MRTGRGPWPRGADIIPEVQIFLQCELLAGLPPGDPLGVGLCRGGGGGVEIILDFAGDWGRGWPLGNLSGLLFLGIWAQDGGTGALGGPRHVRWDLFINVIH